MSLLFIKKREGDFENILVRDEASRVAAHIQIPSGEASRRVVVAMPAGKAALCFETSQPAEWKMEADPVAFTEASGQGGVCFTLATGEGEISIPVSSLLMNHTLMARFGVDQEYRNEKRLRDLIRSGGIQEVESNLGFSLRDLTDRGAIIGPRIEPHGIVFARRVLDGKHLYRMAFAAGGGADLRIEGDRLVLARKDASGREPLSIRIRASTDFDRFTPLPFDRLFNDKGRTLAGKDKHFAEAMRNFEFLSFEEKFLAGSWNFLSYFGRDTLIAARLMWPVLSQRAKRTAIQSVANETAGNGIVNVTDEWTDDRAVANAVECFFREYDKGEMDTAGRIMKDILDGRVPEHPFLDVLDQTYMFPSAASHWFKETSDDDLLSWLQEEHQVLGRTETNQASLLRNWNYILNSAAPYIRAWQSLRESCPGLTPRRIIETRRDEFQALAGSLIRSVAGAANWRDTYQLPWRFISEDINVNLLPMALAAMQEMIGRIRAIGGGRLLAGLAEKYSLTAVGDYIATPGLFDVAREYWNWDQMREHFLIRRAPHEMRRDFERYLEGLENGDAFRGDRKRGEQERDAILRSRERGMTVSDFLRGNRVPDSVKNGIEFTALLLDTEGRPLPLMHGDDVFLLLFGNPTMEQFRKIVQPLLAAYPFGLGFWEDDIGAAITNAIYSPRDTPALNDNWKNTWVKFGPDEYHGRAAWPWVLFALVGGTFDRVMTGINRDGSLENGVAPEDVESFSFILEKMKRSIENLGPLATSEVFKYAPANGASRGWQAEPMGISTPIQLWSAAPANMLIDEALARIGSLNHRVAS